MPNSPWLKVPQSKYDSLYPDHQLTVMCLHHWAVPLDQHSNIFKEGIDARAKHALLQLVCTTGLTEKSYTRSNHKTHQCVVHVSPRYKHAPLSQAACSLFTVADPTADT